MKKRIALIACVAFLLVLCSEPVLAYWPDDYGTCMQSNFNTWGGLYDTREAAYDAAWNDYNDVTSANYGNLTVLVTAMNTAHDNWWSAQSDSNSIFGNCVGQVNIDYNDLDFCAHALGVYNDCFNTYQCEAIEDEDARFLCTEARYTCTSGSGIDRCR